MIHYYLRKDPCSHCNLSAEEYYIGYTETREGTVYFLMNENYPLEELEILDLTRYELFNSQNDKLGKNNIVRTLKDLRDLRDSERLEIKKMENK
jgi:hypothetical protein